MHQRPLEELGGGLADTVHFEANRAQRVVIHEIAAIEEEGGLGHGRVNLFVVVTATQHEGEDEEALKMERVKLHIVRIKGYQK